MTSTRAEHFWGFVPLIFWPVLLWNLARLRLWCRLTGRNVLYEVTPRGQVIVRYASDDPDFLPDIPRPDFARDHRIALSGDHELVHLPGYVIAVNRMMARTGHLVRYIWVRRVARAEPPVIDTS